MRIGIVGAGNIGTNCAVQFLAGGHEVMLSFSRDPASLSALADQLGAGCTSGQVAEAVAFADVVVLSVPWPVIDLALEQTGSLEGTLVIDTTNQFGADGVVDLGGGTAARFNSDRMPGARYTKSFNTITAGYQRQAAGRTGSDRLVQWICGDDQGAKHITAGLVHDAGYAPVDLGSIDACTVMEAPRRVGAVYGEEYRSDDANQVVAAVRTNEPIPPTPTYS